jgi:hypothetical protein
LRRRLGDYANICSCAGATSRSTPLHLRGEVRTVFMDWLRSQRPDLVSRYEELYRRRAYAPAQERARLARMVRRGGAPGSFWRSEKRSEDDMPSDGGVSAPASRQESLF